MNKSTHFSGQPMYGQLINLLDKQKVLNFSRRSVLKNAKDCGVEAARDIV